MQHAGWTYSPTALAAAPKWWASTPHPTRLRVAKAEEAGKPGVSLEDVKRRFGIEP